jgi:hypothetical protein
VEKCRDFWEQSFDQLEALVKEVQAKEVQAKEKKHARRRR